MLWSPARESLDPLGTKRLVEITDGDTPNIRMPVRMLSIDTPQVTARTPEGAAKVDAQFADLAEWIAAGKAPLSAAPAQLIVPELEKGGTRQFEQGQGASAFAPQNTERRLRRPDGPSAPCSSAPPTRRSTPTTACWPTSRRTSPRRSSPR